MTNLMEMVVYKYLEPLILVNFKMEKNKVKEPLFGKEINKNMLDNGKIINITVLGTGPIVMVKPKKENFSLVIELDGLTLDLKFSSPPEDLFPKEVPLIPIIKCILLLCHMTVVYRYIMCKLDKFTSKLINSHNNLCPPSF
mmetsp:Transcript_6178/g.858  ORF Transcript_6178/g.858 Transcript_6178/m.858 type:complete len:141 (-) Transcript_6178:270-692(-)